MGKALILSRGMSQEQIDLIEGEISSPALKRLAHEILDTVNQVKTGQKDYKKGLVELSGYKQVLQIMALEVMRKRLPTH